MTRRSAGRATRPATATVQLDLFAETPPTPAERELAAARVQEVRRAERQLLVAEFARRARVMPDGSEVRWVAPWDTAGGIAAGQDCPGWRCWLCGEIEASEYMLTINHSLLPDPYDLYERRTCYQQNQAAFHARRTAHAAETAGTDQERTTP